MGLKNEADSLYGLCLQLVSGHSLPFGSSIQDLLSIEKAIDCLSPTGEPLIEVKY